MGIVDLGGMRTEPLNIRPEDLTGGNPRAASVRLEGRSLSQAYGQRRHDWRIGNQSNKHGDVTGQNIKRDIRTNYIVLSCPSRLILVFCPAFVPFVPLVPL